MVPLFAAGGCPSSAARSSSSIIVDSRLRKVRSKVRLGLEAPSSQRKCLIVSVSYGVLKRTAGGSSGRQRIHGYKTQRTSRKFCAGPSCVRFADDTNAAMRAIARLRPDRDVHIPAEPGQLTHQALIGEVRELAIEEGRNFRLIDAYEGRRSNPGSNADGKTKPGLAAGF